MEEESIRIETPPWQFTFWCFLASVGAVLLFTVDSWLPHLGSRLVLLEVGLGLQILWTLIYWTLRQLRIEENSGAFLLYRFGSKTPDTVPKDQILVLETRYRAVSEVILRDGTSVKLPFGLEPSSDLAQRMKMYARLNMDASRALQAEQQIG